MDENTRNFIRICQSLGLTYDTAREFQSTKQPRGEAINQLQLMGVDVQNIRCFTAEEYSDARALFGPVEVPTRVHGSPHFPRIKEFPEID